MECRSRTAISFMGLVAGAFSFGAAQAQEGPTPSQIAQPAMESLLDSAMAELMKPGPKRDDWNKGGIDLYQLVATAPGGAAGNYLLSVDKDGDPTAIVTGIDDPAKVAPPSWKPARRTGSEVGGGDAVDVTFGRLDGQSYFAGAQARQKVGDAFCSAGGMVGIRYIDPSASAKNELPEGMVDMMFSTMVSRFEKQRICWRYDLDGDSYRVAHFLEDGHSLPALDAAGYRVKIVAAAPLDRLLASRGRGK